MKHKFLKEEKEIIDWLNEYNIKNYTLITENKYGFVVDVKGDVNLKKRKLKYIPIKFNIVNGYFDCSYNQLKSLEFCPKTVVVFFVCNNNQLISLEGCPKIIGSSFLCNNNQLKSLEFCPQIVGNSFYCNNNQLKSLEFCPEFIGGDFYCQNNQLKTLEGCPKIIGSSFYCFSNQIQNYIYFPEKINGDVFLNDGKKYIFEEAYKIHLKDKAEYEKQLLNEIINKNNIDKNNNSFKI